MNGQAMAIIAVSAVLSALAICSVVLRFLARRFKGVPCFIDDYLIVIALVRVRVFPFWAASCDSFTVYYLHS